MTIALKKIVDEVEQLNEAERGELWIWLQNRHVLTPQSVNETEFEQALAAEGLLTLPTPALSAGEELGPPIETRGRPLSEMLLEERR